MYNKRQNKSDNYNGKRSNDFKSKNFKSKGKNFKSKYNKRYKKQEEAEEVVLPRLNKFIANSGVCSRRQADEYIEKGLITVNGEIVTDFGTKIKPTDVVKFKGKVLKGEENVYYVLNKPKNFITTVSDPKDRYTVMRFFEGKVKERIYPIGRLDRNTTGVLLFTNDGNLTKKLTHPSSNISKIYLVTLDKDVTKNDLVKMVEGIELEDGEISVDAAYYYSMDNKTKVVIDIHSGRNRIVRRIFEHFNYDVKNLDRIEFAGLTKKNLERGKWRKLTDKEIGFLKMLAGKAKISK